MLTKIDSQDDPNSALPCDKQQCHLPECWCSLNGAEIPGNLSSFKIPQMITVTFEDAVNPENFELFTSKTLSWLKISKTLCFQNL